MLRATRLNFPELVDIVQTLQETFYLRVDEQGRAVWDPDAEVPGADLVDTMGAILRHHELCPEQVLLAEPDLTPENLFASWCHGNRKAVARVMCERTRTAIAEFAVLLAGRRSVEEAGMFAVLMAGMEIHSRKLDNKAEIDKSRRELSGMTPALGGFQRTNGEAFRERMARPYRPQDDGGDDGGDYDNEDDDL